MKKYYPSNAQATLALVAVFMLQSLLPFLAKATNYRFVGGTDNFWNSAPNWTNGLKPPKNLQSGDSIMIEAFCQLNTNYTLTAGGVILIKSSGNLVINAISRVLTNNGTIINTGTLSLISGTFNNASSFTNTGQINCSLNFTNTGNFINQGTLNNNNLGVITNNTGGTLSNSSQINNNSGGVISLSAGSLSNTGNVNNNGGGTINSSAALQNNGTIDNKSGAVFNNNAGGTITNSDLLENDGVVNNNAGSVFNNMSSGIFANNAPGDFANNGTMSNTGEIINDGTYDNRSTLYNNAGSTISNFGDLSNYNTGTITNQFNGLIVNADLLFNNGTFYNQGIIGNSGTIDNRYILRGTGKIVGNFNNVGSFLPGNSPGTFTVDGNYTAVASSYHYIEIAGTGSGQFDVISVSGIATLNGTLTVNLIDGYTPQTGDQFVIMDAGSIAGAFATSNLPGGYNWGITYNSDNVVLQVLSPLPVVWAAFEAKSTKAGVQLFWRTAAELNNKGFYVQRSIDATIWEDIGFVEGKGNSSDINTYFFVDTSPSKQTTYYRLRQIDFDQTEDYSPVRSVGGIFSEPELLIYPSLAKVGDRVNLQLMGLDTRQGAVGIYDISGKKVANYLLDAASSLVQIGEKIATPGVYIAKVHAGGISLSQRFVIMQ